MVGSYMYIWNIGHVVYLLSFLVLPFDTYLGPPFIEARSLDVESLLSLSFSHNSLTLALSAGSILY